MRLITYGLIILASLLAACSEDQEQAGAISTEEPEIATTTSAPIEQADPVEQVSEPSDAPTPAANEQLSEAALPSTLAENLIEPQSETPPVKSESVQHVVRGVVTQWQPMILFVQPGDEIVFRQMSGHDSQTIEGLFPVAAQGWKSKMGEEGFSITVTEPGAYIYKCNPHVSTGMVGAIVVGDLPPANLPELQASSQNRGMIGRAIRKLTAAIGAAQQ